MTAIDICGVLLDARDDPARRFALYRLAADAAMDAGDEGLARGLRWLAGEEKHPWFDDRGTLHWCWHVGTDRVDFNTPTAKLPPPFARSMLDHLPIDEWGDWRDYPDFPQAILAAARAAGLEVSQ